MNRKIFGIKISTYLTALAALAIAFLVWFVAKNDAVYLEAMSLV